MPIVLRIKGYRVWFYQADLDEPAHVHVGKADKEAKYWLNPLALARTKGFREHELNEIEGILAEYENEIAETWRRERENRR